MKELPEGWGWKTLKDVGSVINGVTYKSDEAIEQECPGYVAIFRANNINTSLNFDKLVYVPKSRVSDAQFVKKGDIIIAMSSGSKKIVGKAAQALENYNIGFGAFCAVYRTDPETNNQFIGYIFQSKHYRSMVSHLSRGANINNLRKKNILDFKILLPPLPTQRRIVAILKKAEQIKDWHREQGRLLDDYLKSVFLEMFGDPGTNPKGWEEGKFSDIIKETKNGLYKPDSFYGEGIPILRMYNIMNNKIVMNKYHTIRVTENEYEDYKMEPGDILFNRVNAPIHLGKSAVIPEGLGRCVFESKNIRIKIDKSIVNPHYVVYYLATSSGKAEIMRQTKPAVNQATVNNQGLRQFRVPVPPIALQSKFAAIVQKVEKLKAQQEESARQADDLFNALMQKAFTGELVA